MAHEHEHDESSGVQRKKSSDHPVAVSSTHKTVVEREGTAKKLKTTISFVQILINIWWDVQLHQLGAVFHLEDQFEANLLLSSAHSFE